MSYDYLNIGCTPCEEECEQLGPNYNPAKARAECEVFRRQLRRVCGEEPDGATLIIKSFPHDYGTYMEVCCRFISENEKAVEYALRCEGQTPIEWDSQAREELKQAEVMGRRNVPPSCA